MNFVITFNAQRFESFSTICLLAASIVLCLFAAFYFTYGRTRCYKGFSNAFLSVVCHYTGVGILFAGALSLQLTATLDAKAAPTRGRVTHSVISIKRDVDDFIRFPGPWVSCAATAAPQLSPEIAAQRAEAPGGKAETLAPPGGYAPDESHQE